MFRYGKIWSFFSLDTVLAQIYVYIIRCIQRLCKVHHQPARQTQCEFGDVIWWWLW